jgi:signal transduction histidine kinase
MSHELRTPLNAILGFSEQIAHDTTLNDLHRENLETINRSGEHLLGLINDILEVSKIESGQVEVRMHSFDLHRMILGLEEMLAVRARQKELKLTTKCADDVPQYVHTDDGKLRQILINLIGNAIKFTSSGFVTLRVETCQPPKDTGQKQSPETIWLRFSVQDTGLGIASEDLARIFEPFMQLEDGKSQQGTGLGLAISRQQVELLGGRLQVESEVGTGSTFHFEIPITLGDVDGAMGPNFGNRAAKNIVTAPLSAENAAIPLPLEWKEQMHQAILEADVVAMQKLIHDIEAAYPRLSRRLAKLVYDFDYNGIRDLLDAD